ncbi:hypothetical protein HMPREF0262_02188 [Clostridium sp. ATCC 29733]|nr:hypothetical protein HMPREF0262_02188 [Clostridium sp. ATCC 29733]
MHANELDLALLAGERLMVLSYRLFARTGENGNGVQVICLR